MARKFQRIVRVESDHLIWHYDVEAGTQSDLEVGIEEAIRKLCLKSAGQKVKVTIWKPAESIKVQQDIATVVTFVRPTIAQLKKLRAETGASLRDCKDAMVETDCDYEQAKKAIMRKGLAKSTLTMEGE